MRIVALVAQYVIRLSRAQNENRRHALNDDVPAYRQPNVVLLRSLRCLRSRSLRVAGSHRLMR